MPPVLGSTIVSIPVRTAFVHLNPVDLTKMPRGVTPLALAESFVNDTINQSDVFCAVVVHDPRQPTTIRAAIEISLWLALRQMTLWSQEKQFPPSELSALLIASGETARSTSSFVNAISIGQVPQWFFSLVQVAQCVNSVAAWVKSVLDPAAFDGDDEEEEEDTEHEEVVIEEGASTQRPHHENHHNGEHHHKDHPFATRGVPPALLSKPKKHAATKGFVDDKKKNETVEIVSTILSNDQEPDPDYDDEDDDFTAFYTRDDLMSTNPGVGGQQFLDGGEVITVCDWEPLRAELERQTKYDFAVGIAGGLNDSVMTLADTAARLAKRRQEKEAARRAKQEEKMRRKLGASGDSALSLDAAIAGAVNGEGGEHKEGHAERIHFGEGTDEFGSGDAAEHLGATAAGSTEDAAAIVGGITGAEDGGEEGNNRAKSGSQIANQVGEDAAATTAEGQEATDEINQAAKAESGATGGGDAASSSVASPTSATAGDISKTSKAGETKSSSVASPTKDSGGISKQAKEDAAAPAAAGPDSLLRLPTQDIRRIEANFLAAAPRAAFEVRDVLEYGQSSSLIGGAAALAATGRSSMNAVNMQRTAAILAAAARREMAPRRRQRNNSDGSNAGAGGVAKFGRFGGGSSNTPILGGAPALLVPPTSPALDPIAARNSPLLSLPGHHHHGALLSPQLNQPRGGGGSLLPGGPTSSTSAASPTLQQAQAPQGPTLPLTDELREVARKYLLLPKCEVCNRIPIDRRITICCRALVCAACSSETVSRAIPGSEDLLSRCCPVCEEPDFDPVADTSITAVDESLRAEFNSDDRASAEWASLASSLLGRHLSMPIHGLATNPVLLPPQLVHPLQLQPQHISSTPLLALPQQHPSHQHSSHHQHFLLSRPVPPPPPPQHGLLHHHHHHHSPDAFHHPAQFGGGALLSPVVPDTGMVLPSVPIMYGGVGRRGGRGGLRGMIRGGGLLDANPRFPSSGRGGGTMSSGPLLEVPEMSMSSLPPPQQQPMQQPMQPQIPPHMTAMPPIMPQAPVMQLPVPIIPTPHMQQQQQQQPVMAAPPPPPPQPVGFRRLAPKS